MSFPFFDMFNFPVFMTASLIRARCVHIRRVFTAYGLPAEYALIELALIKQLKLAALGMFGRSVARLKRQLEACASLLLLFFLNILSHWRACCVSCVLTLRDYF